VNNNKLAATRTKEFAKNRTNYGVFNGTKSLKPMMTSQRFRRRWKFFIFYFAF
jgi:hypothetical protein